MNWTRWPFLLFAVCAVLGIAGSADIPDAASQDRAAPASRSAQARPANISKSPPIHRPDVARFQKRVEEILSKTGPGKGFWGVLIADTETHEILFALHADQYFAPASDAKLFTTALALATLGPDFRIRTPLQTSGTLDASGVLHGDLVLLGRGDANLSNRSLPYEKKTSRDGPPEKALAALADAAVARGIRQITGDVIADDTLFQPERYPSGWTIDDMLWSYGAAVSAIAVNDNAFTLEIRAGDRAGDTAAFLQEPALDFYRMENTVRTSAPGSEEKLAVARDAGSRTIRVGGTMPLGGAAHRMTIAVEEPAEYAAALLARLLADRGVTISGIARARHVMDGIASAAAPAWTVAERISPPLAADIRLINKISQNLHAELLLRVAAHETTGATTYEDALKFAARFFETAGIHRDDILLSDASGLSRRDLVTPRAIVQMLNYAAAQPWGELYRSTLPVAGQDGTLTERMKNSRAAGRVAAKTGTIEHVNALSGYATTDGDAHLTFAILGGNHHLSVPAADAVLDGIVAAMVEEIGLTGGRRAKKQSTRRNR